LVQRDTLEKSFLKPQIMSWTVRQFSKGQIDRAGAALVAAQKSAANIDPELEIINNWRACHGYPLHAIKMTLLRRAKTVASSAVIAQRLKRLPSIGLKLEHNPAMKLSQMQDIGGCRAVMPSIGGLHDVIGIYERSKSKNPRSGRPVQHERYDYIQNPKPDGYRSYHLIFKYQSEYEDKKPFEGQRIEIQIRTQLQHAWATAVETVQTFTGQALKSKIKTGDPQWLRFFSLMGSAMALRENCSTVPDTPRTKTELVREIRELSRTLSVEGVLSGWGMAVQKLTASPGDAVAFLLVLDANQKTLATTPFKSDELQEASEAYLRVEREMGNRPEIQAVLVSVEDVEALRAAYPNYYLDTSAFIEAVKVAIRR
jgi:ppGpp synthetase/RelA/SpoT-type nucleotidyltranferase